jgi:hypothetical protein
VWRHVRECMTCQKNESENTYLAGLWKSTLISGQRWESVSTYFSTGLPKVHGRDYILGTSSEYEAPQLAEWFFREVFRLHRFPKYSDHDRDNTTLMTFWQELYRLAGTELISVAQLESVGMRHSGLLVWMWVPGTHMIGLFHFWDTSRGDDGALSDSSDEMGFDHRIWDPGVDSSRMLLIVTSIHGKTNFDLLQVMVQPVVGDFTMVSGCV